MNDRFKFRVWDKRNKLWVESMSMCNFGFLTMQNGTDIEEDGFNEDDLLIEQCTGLKDKNGRLIYEGDILQDCEQKIKVVFDEEKHCFMFKYQKTHAYKPIYCLDVLDGDFEVIGNIHENPELMEA